MRRLIENYDGGLKALAAKLGYANPSFISQMVGPHPTRDVTEKSARKFEAKLGLEEGSLDWPAKAAAKQVMHVIHEPQTAHRGTQASGDSGMSLEIIHLMAQACEELQLNLSPMKFADAVAFAIGDAVENGKPPSKEKLRRILALLVKT